MIRTGYKVITCF